MAHYQIKDRWYGNVLYEADGETLCSVLESAVKSRAGLSRADLSGADLSGADLSGAYLSGADLSCAYLSRADLSGADLSCAYLSRADLSGADLSGAYLSGADLSRAYLSRADLSGAYGIAHEIACPLAILLDQPGELVAYKVVNGADEGIYNGGLKYTDGATLSVNNANTDPNDACGAGINVATLQWLLPLFQPDAHRVKVIHFTAADIACIPTATDGKFRLHRCRVGTAEENAAIAERVQKLCAQIHAGVVK